jgi:hypothetical protein
MKRWLSVISLFVISLQVFGQHTTCGSVQQLEHLDKLYPGYKQSVDKAYQRAVKESQRTIHRHSKNQGDPIDTTYTIQVVFHVVYRTSDQNLADSHIIQQLEVINACFNRENADTINTRDIFKPVAGNARIRFVLASEDPDGNPTTGITHTQTNTVTFNTGNSDSRDRVKKADTDGVDAWDTDKYLNVWVCNLRSATNRLSLFGYAYPPPDADFWSAQYFKAKEVQGVVLHYEAVGPNNPANLNRDLYTNEKTAVHEFGHYFGLRHVWGDGGFNGCIVDDFIDDTPVSLRATTGCPIGANTCSNDTFPDQVENYMDYGNAKCSNMFTKGQVEVMRYNLLNIRENLGEQYIEYEEIPPVIVQNIYPNPFGSELKYEDDTLIQKWVTLELYNAVGQKVLETSRWKEEFYVTFDHIDVAQGYYRAIIKHEDEIYFETSVIRIQTN